MPARRPAHLFYTGLIISEGRPMPLATGTSDAQVSADFSQCFSEYHLCTARPYAIMQTRSRQEDYREALTGGHALALKQPYGALAAVAYMPQSDAENRLRILEPIISSTTRPCCLMSACIHELRTTATTFLALVQCCRKAEHVS